MFAAVGSCLGSAAAFLLCGCCKCVGGQVLKHSARAGYCALFLLGMLIAWCMRDFVEPLANKIPRYTVPSDAVWIGEQAVYRLTFGNFCFFGLLSLILVGVKYKSDKRDEYIQHGSWAIKGVVWLVFLIFPFFIPGDFVWYGWMARIGSGFFLIIQMLILLDFTHALNDAWFSKGEENKYYMYGLLATTVGLFLATIALSGVAYYLFKPAGAGSCSLNVSLITYTLIACVGFSILSVHPAAAHGSLFPSSVISLYCMYLCLSALQSEPRGDEYKCNGLGQKMVVSGSSAVIGMLLTLGAVIYSALRAGSNTGTFFLGSDEDEETGGQPLMAPEADTSAGLDGVSNDAPQEQTTERKPDRAMDEFEPVTYNYSFFHAIFAVASMYVAMLMTDWGTNEEEKLMDVSWVSVWVKMGSQFVTTALYIWTLSAPLLFPDRDFS
ncbi:hypothetical protein BSKO_12275 [Bryopsis sp. KO-2023]|nr:hypothetical protein BSKO_12275 [Bryopsis sp. KO-2023]